MAKRMSRTLAAIKEQLGRRRHHGLGQTGRWLASVVRGWRQDYAVAGNYDRLYRLRVPRPKILRPYRVSTTDSAK